MRTIRSACLVLALALAPAFGPLRSIAATPSPIQQTIDAMSRAHAAVVGVQVLASEDAPSAETLGRQRRGSGVVIGADGLILTIGYLMLEAEHIQILTQDGRQLPAQAVAYDLATGFGLLRPLLPLRGVAAVPLGSHPELEPGTVLMTAIGGEGGDVAMTQLVAKRAFSGYWEYFIDTALFTSPPIANHSGAPLFNQKGELVGIGSLLVMDALGTGRQWPGNMFVPVDLLKPILAEMRSTGSTRLSKRPWLGVNSVEQSGRVQVARVSKASPASVAGLQPGDVVLAVDGTKVTTLEGFYKKLWDRADAQAEVQLTVLQGADVKTLTVKPVDRMSTLRKPKGI
ncbi:S1C family serine protease [Pseudorhodoferax sp. Leaf274]|uniref:S1C family serine protease n=1 Tax=Pseudorhodoferax sp. Leaf274 TaxID=1736318 RepID=UPI000702BC01|nr:S1C family serine protease [Pseudorhodoferax sp. Leaf274]KQP44259.1 signal protein PDZ [Pseudorhodoferax sp. Leaf274]